MARPTKKGLDYFPLDTKLGTKLKLVKANYGHKGFGLLIRLFQLIYSNGYYISWTEDEESLFRDEEGFSFDDGFLSSIVEYCLNKKIFNNELFKKYKILTSKGIQERYVEAKTGTIYMDRRYFLLKYANFDINAELIEVNSKKTIVFSEFSTQRKVKETKEKKSKEKNNKRLLCSFKRYKLEKSKIEYEFDKTLTEDENEKIYHIFCTYEADLILCALRETLMNGKKDVNYLYQILVRFEAEGINVEKYNESGGNI